MSGRSGQGGSTSAASAPHAAGDPVTPAACAPRTAGAAAPAPRVTLGIPARADEGDLPGALASLTASAAHAGLAYEIVVAVNGPGEGAPAEAGVAGWAAAAGVTLERGADGRGSGAPQLRLLRLATASKVAAWNAIRAAARAPLIVFADADVRVAPSAIGRLLARLDAAPELVLVGAREAPVLGPRASVAARLAALPYRFPFANVPGRLYALRAAAAPAELPAHVLHEDAYLTIRLGRTRFAKDDTAVVYFQPPATWREYARDRVRNEVAKLQLARDFPELLAHHGVSPYPWRALVGGLRPREYPLLMLLALVRLAARARAARVARAGFRSSWQALPSTKAWSERMGHAPGAGTRGEA